MNARAEARVINPQFSDIAALAGNHGSGEGSDHCIGAGRARVSER
jgi:hypothetical protein